MTTGVYNATKKDGSVYYRVSITYKNKHISIGSYDSEELASMAYITACDIISKPDIYYIDADLHTTSYELLKDYPVPFPYAKFISLINFRDNGIYIKTPIYLCDKLFLYFLTPETTLIFSTDDLFIIPITLLCAVVDTTSSTIMVCRQAYLQDLAYETTPSREKTTFSAMVMNTISAMKMYVSSTNTTESAILKKTDV